MNCVFEVGTRKCVYCGYVYKYPGDITQVHRNCPRQSNRNLRIGAVRKQITRAKYLQAALKKWKPGDRTRKEIEALIDWLDRKGKLPQACCGTLDKYAPLLLDKDAWGEDWGEKPDLASPVRVGFISPSSLYAGGAERWLLDLVDNTPGIIWEGTACVGQWNDPDYTKQIEERMPVFYGEEAVKELINTDILITWGETFLERTLPKNYKGRVVFVSHGSDMGWTRRAITAAKPYTTDFVAVSPAAMQPFEGLSVTPTLIENGINGDRCKSSLTHEQAKAKLGYTSDDIVVGYLGRIGEEKRLHLQAQAVALLPPRYKCLYVGNGFVLEQIKKEALPLGERVRFYPATEEIADYLAAMDVFLMASQAEGFCLALTEAMYAGVPILTTHVGAVGYLEEQVGRQWEEIPIDPTPPQIAEAIERVVALPPEETAKRRETLQTIIGEKFLASNMGGRWVAYLRGLK